MSKVIDVIYELTNIDFAIWQVFSIDSDLHLLNTKFDDEGVLEMPTNWNEFWRVSTKAPEADLYNTRFLITDYQQLIDSKIKGFEILAAGYPSDDIESMLRDRIFKFKAVIYSDKGEVIEIEQVDDGVRVVPTERACDRYRELYPEIFNVDIGGKNESVLRGNFSRHGL